MIDFSDSFDAIDWLGGTQVIGRMFQHPVNLRKTGQHLVEIQRIAKQPGTAAEMAEAWKQLQAGIGSPFLYELLGSAEFRDLCPTPRGTPAPPPMDDVLTVWTDNDGKRVVAKDKDTHYLFVVE